MRAGAFFIGAMGLLASSAAVADADPICADRPGKGTSTCTVPQGHFQIETDLVDWSLQRGGGERDTSLSLGETTFKYGLTDHSDIELDVTPWQRSTSRVGGLRDSASGFGDLTVIYKHAFTGGDAPLQVTAYPFVKIPAAKRPVGNGEWEGGLVVPVAYSLPNTSLSISLSPELDWVADGDAHGHHLATAQVIGLGWQVTKKLNLSGELWGQWDWDPAGTDRQASADVAVAYLLRNDIQLDGGANFGLNSATPDIEWYAGISKQF